jgi:hypothetical protein
VWRSDHASLVRCRSFLCGTVEHEKHQPESRPEYRRPFVRSERSANGSRSHLLERDPGSDMSNTLSGFQSSHTQFWLAFYQSAGFTQFRDQFITSIMCERVP